MSYAGREQFSILLFRPWEDCTAHWAAVGRFIVAVQWSNQTFVIDWLELTFASTEVLAQSHPHERKSCIPL